MKSVICIGIGGFLGALCRHGLTVWVGRTGGGFPLGTLAVNTAGCLLFGILFGLADSYAAFSKDLRLFVFTGFLGAFTTFSAFGYDTVAHLRDGQHANALANIGLSVALGLLAIWLGLSLASTFTGKSP